MQKLLERTIIKRTDAGQGKSTNNWCYKRDMSRELFRIFPCSRAMQLLCRLFKCTHYCRTYEYLRRTAFEAAVLVAMVRRFRRPLFLYPRSSLGVISSMPELELGRTLSGTSLTCHYSFRLDLSIKHIYGSVAKLSKKLSSRFPQFNYAANE